MRGTMAQKPDYRPPKVSTYRPTSGEFITRPIGGISTNESSYDPWATTSGSSTKKYGYTALHPSVQPALKFLVEAPFWVDWDFHAQNDYEEFPQYESLDDDIIELLRRQVDSMEFETFTNSIKSIWKDALIYGFSVAELVYGWDGRFNMVEAIKTHSPFLFDLYTDAGNNLDQLHYSLGGVTIEKETLPKFVITTYPFIEHGRHYGSSILKSIYFDVKVIEILEQSYTEGSRRLSIKPMLHHWIAENLSKEDKEATEKALFDIDNGCVVSLPAMQDVDGKLVEQHRITVLEDRANWEGVRNIKDMLDILYKRVNRSLGLPDDLGFSTANVGSLAKAREEMNLYTQTIVNNQYFIESFANRQIVRAMVRYNYPGAIEDGNYKLPLFQFGSVEEEYDTAIVQNMIDMINAGILDRNGDRDYIRNTLGLPAAPTEIIEGTIEPEPATGQQTTRSLEESILAGE